MRKKIGSLIEIHVYEDMTSCTDLAHHVVFGKVNTDDKDLCFQKKSGISRMIITVIGMVQNCKRCTYISDYTVYL